VTDASVTVAPRVRSLGCYLMVMNFQFSVR
jgi:hypothetical protein